MSIEVKMPRLSDTMEVGTVVKWNVKEGQKVASGDVIADIETDKATMELQTFDDGTVAALPVNEGQSVPVGTIIMLLAESGEDAASVKSSAKAGAGAAAASAQPSVSQADDSGRTGETRRAAEKGFSPTEREDVGTPTLTSDSAPATRPEAGRAGGHAQSNGSHAAPAGDRVFASPLARKIAEEHGIDLAAVRGTGPSGRIVRKDVEDALTAGVHPAARSGGSGGGQPQRQPASQTFAPMPPAGAGLEGKTVALSNMRRTIAKRLVESKTTVPHYQVTVSARLDALMSLRAQLNEQLTSQGVKLSVNDFLVRACALAMHQHPFVNSRWVNKPGAEAIELLADVNIGVAISLPPEKGGGLVVATLRRADQMGLRHISAQTRAYAEKARSKGLGVEEMADSTFTISNLGMYGVEHFTAIINPPNAAILAVGAAVEQPVIETDQDGSKSIGIGHVMSMTMSSDHRIIDGAMAAQYLATVKDLLEKPATLLV